MKALVGVALALALLAALVLGAAALLLPRMVASDAVRARIESAAETALGRALHYERLDFGLLPPSLVVVGPSIAGATPEAPPIAEARRILLRVALLPLFARTVSIDGLVVDGATLRLRRTAAGLELPRLPADDRATGSAPTAGTGDGLPPLAVRVLELRSTTLILEDAAVVPRVTWELRDVKATLRGESVDAPLRVNASFALLSGGRASVDGTATLAGDVDLDLELDAIELAHAKPYFDDVERFAGTVGGSLELEGPVRSPSRIAARLAVGDADMQFDEIALRGPLRIAADLVGGPDKPNGSFDIDATGAELVYGGAIRKPAGTSATVKGRIVSGPGGVLGFDDLKLKVHNLDATVEMPSGRTRMDVRAPAFDLAGWDVLLPALAGWQLRGRVTLDGLALEREPAGLHGRVGLEGIQAVHPRGGTLALSGTLQGDGPRVRGEGLELVAADQPFRVDAALVDLGSPAPRWQLHFEGRDADVHRLLDGFTRRGDTLHGRLAIDGDLGLPVDTGGDPLAMLAGRVRLEIRDGWTTGRSLIKTSLDALVAVASPLDLVTRALNIGSHDRSKDRFDSVTGTFDIAEGIARTDDLRIVESDHSIGLSGTLRLADLALDMRGSLSFAGEGDAGAGRGIPLAHVQGTLGNPRVEVTAEAARSFAAALEPNRLGKKLERALGPKAAQKLADGLGDLLHRAAPERR